MQETGGMYDDLMIQYCLACFIYAIGTVDTGISQNEQNTAELTTATYYCFRNII
jgi:hypothetical protein